MEPKWSQMEPKNEQNEQNEQFFKFVCVCGKSYAYNRGLSKHKKTCTYEQNMHLYKNDNELKDLTNLVLEVVKHNKELTALNHEAQKQNQELTNKIIEMSKTGIIINAQNNSNNKTFNLNVFLNETCKDAMNITEFVDSLKLQLADLEDVGKLGFVEGISKIIIKNLKALDVHKRPVHCADKKREIIYIKDEDKWEKENEQKLRLRKAIKQVAFKNENLLLKFKELYPGCNYSESKYADHYSKLVIEAFGGVGNNDIEKQNKIIRNITNEILIEKY
jgi:predicted RNase H-like nuclease (RuvC/YqgF family)